MECTYRPRFAYNEQRHHISPLYSRIRIHHVRLQLLQRNYRLRSTCHLPDPGGGDTFAEGA
jgi:hypothetical protein